MQNGKFKQPNRELRRNVNRQLKMEWNSPFTDQDLSNDFSTNEVMAIIKTLKVGKAPGPDNFHPEFFLQLDEKCFEWFRILFSLCLKLNTTKTVCSSFHLSNILADFEASQPLVRGFHSIKHQSILVSLLTVHSLTTNTY